MSSQKVTGAEAAQETLNAIKRFLHSGNTQVLVALIENPTAIRDLARTAEKHPEFSTET